MKIALAQINTTVGDFDGNVERILQAAERAASMDADVMVTPELAICGYPPKDLVEKRTFVEAAEAARERVCRGIPRNLEVVAGTIVKNESESGRGLFNAALVLERGSIKSQHYKTLLPTYDVFDEDRHFEPADARTPARLGGRFFGVVICEDIWTSESSGARQRYRGSPLDDLMQADVWGEK